MREKVAYYLESPFGRRLILGIILANAVLVGLNTYTLPNTPFDHLLANVDLVILVLFTVELLLRFYAAPSIREYFRDPWNVFDLIVVTACYIPSLGAIISVARTLRVLRTLRAVAVFPTLRRIVGALLRSLPGLGNVALLLLILVYVYAVVGTSIFGQDVPEFFGSLHRTSLTLFQVVTLEGWNDLLFAVMEKFPWGWIYFVSFIFLGTFTLFNLFVGVIVSNLENVTTAQDFEKEIERDQVEAQKLEAIMHELKAIRARLDEGRS